MQADTEYELEEWAARHGKYFKHTVVSRK